MMDEEIKQEAERLASLNEKQLEIEMISVALRLGRQSDASSEELQRLDQECLDALIGSQRPTNESVRDESESEGTIG